MTHPVNSCIGGKKPQELNSFAFISLLLAVYGVIWSICITLLQYKDFPSMGSIDSILCYSKYILNGDTSNYQKKTINLFLKINKSFLNKYNYWNNIANSITAVLITVAIQIWGTFKTQYTISKLLAWKMLLLKMWKSEIICSKPKPLKIPCTTRDFQG